MAMDSDPQTDGRDGEREGVPAPGAVSPDMLATLVRGKNINEKTFLATDYLNHFNEIIMLLEMVPGAPEFFADCKEWAPKSYAAHFRDSAFADKELAILAYEHAPQPFRRRFDTAIARMNAYVAEAMAEIERAVGDGDEARVGAIVATVTGTLRTCVDAVSAIIHGDKRTVDQAEVDEIIAGA